MHLPATGAMHHVAAMSSPAQAPRAHSPARIVGHGAVVLPRTGYQLERVAGASESTLRVTYGEDAQLLDVSAPEAAASALAEVAPGPLMRAWRIETDTFTCAWPRGLTLADDPDALSAFVLSLGPILKVAGQTLPVPLPYAVFYYIVPGFAGMRAPGRFAEIVLLIGAVFAARGYDVLRERAPGRVARGALLVVVTAAMLATSMSTPIPLIDYPGRETMPAAWKWIAKQSGHFVILELPMPSSEADESERDAVRQIWTLYHGKARADGLSGFSSPAHEGFRALMQSFPERLAVRAIAERGVRYVIVRYGEYVPQDAARIRYDLASVREMAPVFESGSDVVYSLANAELLAEEGSRDIVKRYKRERASAGRRR